MRFGPTAKPSNETIAQVLHPSPPTAKALVPLTYPNEQQHDLFNLLHPIQNKQKFSDEKERVKI